LKVGFVNYDIIPLLYPDFFTRISARHFRAMYHNTLKVADMLFVTAEQIRNDVLDYCRSGRLPEPEIKVFQPGADLHIGAEVGSLPPGLAPGRYAIFVSTIEPRKGHGLLFAVWKRLLATGVPQATNFKLVFVGRRGWLVDDLIDIVKRHPSFGSSLLLLSGVSDNQLVALYRNAAFGLYPSMYEGYGLPVVELFAHGKAVLASTGGALKEVVGDLSPTLDPKDEDAWFEAMKNWIENPAARQPFEAAIRERFTHPSWRQASEAFFRILNESVSAADQMTGLGD
jgi:glycosyltransferase involved in cell wall biosynthesis